MNRRYTLSILLSSALLVMSGCGSNTQTSPDTNGAGNTQNTDAPIISSKVNESPVATFDNFSINRDVTYNGQLTATDTNGDTLAYDLVSPCKHGTVTVDTNGCFTYTPNPGFKGKDSFTYKAKDELSACPVKTVTIDVTQTPITIPNAPSNLKLEALSTCKIRVSWDDNSNNETGFEVFRDGELASVVGANVLTTDICGKMAPATEHSFEVRAKNNAGSSAGVAGLVTTKDITTAPDAPSGLAVSAIDKTSARLVWIDNAWNESEYDIYVNGAYFKTIAANCNCTVVTGLTAGVDYTFQVTAKNKIGSTSSQVIQATTEAEPVDEIPTITINGTDVTLVVGDTYTDAGATANDAEDGDLTVTSESTVDVNTVGDYSVKYTVTDSAGQSVSEHRSVKVVVASALNTKASIPIDSNIELGGETGILYYVDPRVEENGFNRALRIDYINMAFTDLNVSGINPHSIDRAGDSDKFYIRTQNDKAFDVINFGTGEVKTVDLVDHQPRAIGATNTKYNLQILSARNMQVFDIIDTTTDTVLETIGDRTLTPGVTTGHALWFDEDHFGLIDRKSKKTLVYKVVDNDGVLSFVQTSVLTSPMSFHAIERVVHPQTRDDLVTFYANGEGSAANGQVPAVLELKFNPETGVLTNPRTVDLPQSTEKVHGISPVTHHSGISPDGKYFYAPVLDGKVYIIDRATMAVVKTIDAKLGAAHVEFSASLNIAVVTNHFSNDLTIIDLTTQTVKANINIGQGQEFHEEDKHLLQPHFSYLSADGKKFYTFATQDGIFLEVNLETLTIDRKLLTGGAPEQAHS